LHIIFPIKNLITKDMGVIKVVKIQSEHLN
jgi:hypothetical protein